MGMEKSRSVPNSSSTSYTVFGYGMEDGSNSYSFNGPGGKEGSFTASSDPELQRRKRVAAYNSFSSEGKLKASVKNSFKWIKSRFLDY